MMRRGKRRRRKLPAHLLDDLYRAELKRVREGDVSAARKMMLACARNLREFTDDGKNNLSSRHAIYLAQVLKRLAGSDQSARLFCLGMPGNRPKRDDSPIHLERARKVLAVYRRGGTLDAALATVAKREFKSVGAIRASWKRKGFVAEFELLNAAPESARGTLKLPGEFAAFAARLPQEKGGT